MKRLSLAATLCLALAATSVHAQSLQPQMSAQDVTAQMEVPRGHVIVPILAMLFLLAAGSGGGAMVESDERLKTDIVPVGRTSEGLTLYEFGYLHREGRFRGVMAQEVLTQRPDAVIRGAGGLMRVDYAALGLEMIRID
jgi:hypothetical protein